MPGIMPSRSPIGPILRTALQLLDEVVEVQLVRLHLLAEGGDVLLAELLLRLFDQREHVAHAQDARGEALRVEGLQSIGALTGADELDRQAGDGADRERRATAGVAVELGQDEAGDLGDARRTPRPR